MPDDDWFTRLRSKLEADSPMDDIANTPLETLQDCYDFLDAGWPHKPPSFAEVQRAYRSKLWRYNPKKDDLVAGAVEFRTLMTAKIKQAYMLVCTELRKDPQEGLEETEESLIAERDRLLEGWKDWWCGTPSMHIAAEYSERIEALKNQNQS